LLCRPPALVIVFISANYAEGRGAPGRLIYAEIVDVDTALVSA